jgi:predicted RNA-binding protein YlqC (UPF0109 family)
MADSGDLFAQPDFVASKFEDSGDTDFEDDTFEGDARGDARGDVPAGSGRPEDDESEDDDESEEDDESEDGEDDEDANLASGGMARAVLQYLAASLVDDADSVVVEVSEARNGTKLSLHVAASDMGRVIGRRGRTAQAIRTLVRAAAATEGTDASVDIVD